MNNQTLMLSEEDMATFQRAWDKWGPQAQLTMINEESAELIKSVCKYLRHRDEKHANMIVEEMVDTVIMCEQFLYIFKKGQDFYQIRRAKMDRLEEKLKNV